MEIKSKLLLPSVEKYDEEGEEEVRRKKLINKLIEYKKDLINYMFISML